MSTRIETAAQKAAVLTEALPWLQRFHGTTVVIKYGGHAMLDDKLRQAFAEDMVFLRLAGLRPVVVQSLESFAVVCGSPPRRPSTWFAWCCSARLAGNWSGW
jgi:hypothetical protein